MFEYIQPAIYNELKKQVTIIANSEDINTADGTPYPAITYDISSQTTNIAFTTALSTVEFDNDKSIQMTGFTTEKNDILMSSSSLVTDLSNSISRTILEINDLGTDINSYSGRLNTVDASANTFENHLNRLDISFVNLHARVGVFGDRFTQLEVNAVKLDSSASVFETRFTRLDGSVNKLDISTSVFESRITSLDTQSYRLETSMNSLETNISRLDGVTLQLDTSANRIESRLLPLETSTVQYDVCANILHNRLSILDSSTNTLEVRANAFHLRNSKLDISASKLDISATTFESKLSQLDTSASTHASIATTYSIRIPSLETSFNEYQPRLDLLDASIQDISVNRQPFISAMKPLSASFVDYMNGETLEHKITTLSQSITDLSNAFDTVNGDVFNTIASKADLTGATFTGQIYSNENISFTNTSKLKYTTGISGQVLISNSNGLLSLQPMPVNDFQAPLSGATFTGPIYTNANIVVSGSTSITAPTTVVTNVSGSLVRVGRTQFTDASYINIDVSLNINAVTGTIPTITNTGLSCTGRGTFTDGSFGNVDVYGNLSALSATISTFQNTTLSGGRSVFIDVSFGSIDVSNTVTARTGRIGTLSVDTVTGRRSVFTDGSYGSLDMSNVLTSRTGTIGNLTVTNITSARSIITDGSYENVDISRNMTSKNATIPTLNANTITGNTNSFTDGSFGSLDISRNITAINGNIITLTNTDISGGNTTSITDGSYISIDISRNITAISGTFITSLATTTLTGGNTSNITDGSYGNMYVTNNVNAKKCKLIDGSFTNIIVNTVRCPNSGTEKILISNANGLMALNALTGAVVGLGNVNNTTDKLKPVSTLQTAALATKANLSGATFTGPIFTDFSINTTRIKYSAGAVGQVLVSDNTGLLSLTSSASSGITFRKGSLYTPSPIWRSTDTTATNNGATYTVFKIDLSAGNYLLCHRIGIKCTGTLKISSYECNVNKSVDTLSNYEYATNYSEILPPKNIGSGNTYMISSSACKLFARTEATYYVNLQINYTADTTGNLSISNPLLEEHSYIYAIKLSDATFNSTVLTFNPKTSLPADCWVWLDADDLFLNTSVSTWTDKSGKGNHCTQSTAANQPTINVANLQNNRPTLNFSSASSQFLVGPTTFAIGTNSYYLFVVVKFNDTNTANWQGVFNKSSGPQYGRLWCYRDSQGLQISIQDNNPIIFSADNVLPNTAFTIYSLAVNRITARTHILNRNGTPISSGIMTYTTIPNLINTTPIIVGAHNDGVTGGTPPMSNSYLNGNIAEIIGYAQASDMNVLDIQKVEGYLAWKWGLQTNLPSNHPYFSGAPARAPNSIAELNLGNYSIVYQNDCTSLSNLTVNNNGVTVVNGTYSTVGTTTTYGAINTGISLLNKTILVDMSSNFLGNFFFGCDSSGSGYMIRFETRPDNNLCISYMAAPISWTNWGTFTNPTEPSSWTIITGPAPAGSANDTSRRLQASVWYTIIISIASDGTLSWAAQKQGTTTFINNTTYPQYTNIKVNSENRFIAVHGDGGNGRTQFDNIKIYNQALL